MKKYLAGRRGSSPSDAIVTLLTTWAVVLIMGTVLPGSLTRGFGYEANVQITNDSLYNRRRRVTNTGNVGRFDDSINNCAMNKAGFVRGVPQYGWLTPLAKVSKTHLRGRK